MKAKRFKHCLIVASIVMGSAFQNCSESELMASYYISAEDSIGGYGAMNLVSDCMNDTSYNTCIFWKNPVAQRNASFDSPVRSSTDLSDYQIHADNIQGDENGELSNESIVVEAAGDGERKGPYEKVRPVDGNYKFVYKDDPNHKVGQVHSYAWANYVIKFAQRYLGTWYAVGKRITINSYYDTDDSSELDPSDVAYWNNNKKKPQIVLGHTLDEEKGEEYALDGGVLAHEFAHANISYATGWAIIENSEDKNESCNGEDKCCSSRYGCSKAINEGQADYLAAIVFYRKSNEYSVSLGETFENSLMGLSSCNEISRNLFKAESTIDEKDEAYHGCNDPELYGEVHIMGTLYAALWWAVRDSVNKAQGREGSGSELTNDIDLIYMEHLMYLKGDDDFVTALDIIKTIDATYFGGKYFKKFEDEWARRGLTDK